MYIGIDPGNRESAFVVMNPDRTPIYATKCANADLPEQFRTILQGNRHLYQAGIECVASYGMPVGADVFETAEWSGRIRNLLERWVCPSQIFRVYRKSVKMHLCGNPRANDSNIRQAIIDLYPPDGGGKNPQIGIKSKPGPLFGFAADKWAALGVALTVKDSHEELPQFV